MKRPIICITCTLFLLLALATRPVKADDPAGKESSSAIQENDYSVELPPCEKRNPEDAKEFQKAFHDWADYLYWADLDSDGFCDLITLQSAPGKPEMKGIPVYLSSIMCFRYYNSETDKFDIAKVNIGCGGEMFRGGPPVVLYYNKTANRVEVANPPWFYSGPEGPYLHDSPLAWFHFRMMIRSELLVSHLPLNKRCCGYGSQAIEMWAGPHNPNFPEVIFSDIYPKRWAGYARIPGLREKALKIQAEEIERIGGKPLFSESDTPLPKEG